MFFMRQKYKEDEITEISNKILTLWAEMATEVNGAPRPVIF